MLRHISSQAAKGNLDFTPKELVSMNAPAIKKKNRYIIMEDSGPFPRKIECSHCSASNSYMFMVSLNATHMGGSLLSWHLHVAELMLHS